MKKFTNYTPGLRGINTESGTVWIEPGQTVEIDPKDIVGSLPDLGKKAAASDDDGEIGTLRDQVADLTKQVEALTKPADAKK